MSMITSESFWLVELTMDDTAIAKPHSLAKTTTKKGSKQNKENGEDDDTEEEECDVEFWETLTKSFRQVQTVHQNRTLIQQVNENHQSGFRIISPKMLAYFARLTGISPRSCLFIRICRWISRILCANGAVLLVRTRGTTRWRVQSLELRDLANEFEMIEGCGTANLHYPPA